MRKLKDIMRNMLNRVTGSGASLFERHLHFHYSRQFKRYLKNLGIPNSPVEGEEEYIKKWGVFNGKVEPYSYRLFSRFMGPSPDIVPEDIGHAYIEDVLNPPLFSAYYSDKNLFEETFKEGTLPKTVARRIGGSILLDKDYQPLTEEIKSNSDRLILKPSAGTSSGVGVELFVKSDKGYVNSTTGEVLTREYLTRYGDDLILQEAVRQSEYVSYFCKTAVNTIRLATYRSVKDERVHVTAGILRIGRDGEFVDNAHAGGVYLGVNTETGELGKTAFDQYGNQTKEWNGIDFSKSAFKLPNWEEVVEFAKYIGSSNHHSRLLALDIALDENDKPKLIEYNIRWFSYWLFMFNGQLPLGEFTDEIIEHCLKHKRNRRQIRIV